MLHHIAMDEWSDRPLLRDLTPPTRTARRRRARLGAAAGAVRGLRPLAARLLGDAGRPGQQARRQLAYWQRALAGLPDEIPLPADRPRPAAPTVTAAGTVRRRPCRAAELIDPLRELAGPSPAQPVHGAARRAGRAAVPARRGHRRPDRHARSPGRTDAALDDLVGFFVNTLVLRTDLSGDPTFTELLGRVRERRPGRLRARQDVPFDRLVEAGQPAAQLGRNPLFQVMIGYLHRGRRRDTAAGPAHGVTAGVALADPKVDLNFTFVDAGPRRRSRSPGVRRRPASTARPRSAAATASRAAGRLAADPDCRSAGPALLAAASATSSRGWTARAGRGTRRPPATSLFAARARGTRRRPPACPAAVR